MCPVSPTASSTSTPSPDALAAVREEASRIADADVLSPRVDLPTAALMAIGAAPEIEAHRASIVALFGDGGRASLDKLVPSARAAMLAHAEHLAVAERDLEAMFSALAETRSKLFNAAAVLIERKLVQKKSLANLEGGNSYQAKVVDTTILTAWFRGVLPGIGDHTKVTALELDAAQTEAEEFGRLVNERDQARAGTSETARARARAFTVFVKTYERIRQMLTYLRWHEGDVERIAPSLYAQKSRKQGDELVVPPTTSNGPAIPPGMPGADPFSRPVP